MKRVLITGATGFIGRHSLARLLAAGYEVHATTIDSALPTPIGINWHTLDLLNARQIEDLLASLRPSHLLHFAWYAAPGKYSNAPENVLWEQASLALLQSFAKAGGQRVLMAGTCAEYDWNYGYCSEQGTPLMPRTLYGVCKHALQLTLEAYAAQLQLSAAWGRIFFLYGPYEYPERLVPNVIRALLKGETARCSHGEQIRDFMHVQDVADAFVALLESNVIGSINIASGQPISIRDLVYLIANKIGRMDLLRLGVIPTPAEDPPLLVGDIRRLRHEVKWEPRYTLDEGIEDTIAWWKQKMRGSYEIDH